MTWLYGAVGLALGVVAVESAHLEPVTSRENTLRGQSIQSLNARKTECVHGHPFTLENTRIDSRGHRHCRTCQAESKARPEQREKQREYSRRSELKRQRRAS